MSRRVIAPKDETTSETPTTSESAQAVPYKTPAPAIPTEPQPGSKVKMSANWEAIAQPRPPRIGMTPEQAAAVAGLRTALPDEPDEPITDLAEWLDYWQDTPQVARYTMLIIRQPDAPLFPGQTPRYRRPADSPQPIGEFRFVTDFGAFIRSLQIANNMSGGEFRVVLKDENKVSCFRYDVNGVWIGSVPDPMDAPAAQAPVNGSGAKPEKQKSLLEQLREHNELQAELKTTRGETEASSETMSKERAELEFIKDTGFITNTMGMMQETTRAILQAQADALKPAEPESTGRMIARNIFENEQVREPVMNLAGQVVGGVVGWIWRKVGTTPQQTTQPQPEAQPQTNTQPQPVDVFEYLLNKCRAAEEVNMKTDEVMLRWKREAILEYTGFVALLRKLSLEDLKAEIIRRADAGGKHGPLVREAFALSTSDAWLNTLQGSVKSQPST